MAELASAVRAHVHRFAERSEARIVILGFALALPLLMAAATGIEYGRALKLRSEVQVAADAAVRSAANALGSDDAIVLGHVRRALSEHLRPSLRRFTAGEMAASRDAVSVRLPVKVRNYVSALFGNGSFNFVVTSFATRADAVADVSIDDDRDPLAYVARVPHTSKPARGGLSNDTVFDAWRLVSRTMMPGS